MKGSHPRCASTLSPLISGKNSRTCWQRFFSICQVAASGTVSMTVPFDYDGASHFQLTRLGTASHPRAPQGTATTCRPDRRGLGLCDFGLCNSGLSNIHHLALCKNFNPTGPRPRMHSDRLQFASTHLPEMKPRKKPKKNSPKYEPYCTDWENLPC
jgi:hypothetical protein